MTQQAREVSEFGPWVDHFEQNVSVHARADGAIDFDGHCAIPGAVRRPPIASVRRFQLGESGDGARIVADEHPHVRFQQQRLRAGFDRPGIAVRSLAFGLWWLTAIGATVVVAMDHGPLLDAIGYRRVRFVRDVLADFAKVAEAVLRR
jgi:hypothetical protein